MEPFFPIDYCDSPFKMIDLKVKNAPDNPNATYFLSV